MDLNIPHSQFGGRIIKSQGFAGLRLLDGVFSAKTKVPAHSHEFAVFCVALKGMCNEVFAGKVRPYEVSTIEFLPPNQSHSLDFPFADTRAFSLEIDTWWLDRVREFSLRLDNSVHSHGGLLSLLMMKIYDEFRNLDGTSPVAIQGLALEMLAAVSRNQSRPTTRQPQRWLAKAMEFLHESFTEHLTLTQVASAAGVHPVYLAREFRRCQCCTIGEYIRRLRIERACRQLSSSDESLATIAAAAGFSDQSHFSRTFKRVMRMTPAQYRANFDRR